MEKLLNQYYCLPEVLIFTCVFFYCVLQGNIMFLCLFYVIENKSKVSRGTLWFFRAPLILPVEFPVQWIFKKCTYRNACKTSARKYGRKQNEYYFTVAFSMNPDLSMFSCLQKIKLKWIFILLMSYMQRGIGNHDTSNPDALNFGWILYRSSFFFFYTIINKKYRNTVDLFIHTIWFGSKRQDYYRTPLYS